MLKAALNALTFLHSRAATIKRLGASVDTYSPCRITPSNYFRSLRGPEYTTIKGSEFIIPVDSLTGQFAQKLTFDRIPDEGTFKLTFGVNTTTALAFNCTAADIQTALRLFSELTNVLVTGSFLLGFTITFVGFSTAPAFGSISESTLKESATGVSGSWEKISIVWPDLLKKGDRIIDGTKQWSVDEIVEMHDLGATVMAYRCRVD